MVKELSIDRQTILNNVISFCSNDEASGKELFEIIQKSVADSLEVLNSSFKEKEAALFIKTAHKLRFSLSIIKVEEIHQKAIYIDDCITDENFNGSASQEIMKLFIAKMELLNKELNN